MEDLVGIQGNSVGTTELVDFVVSRVVPGAPWEANLEEFVQKVYGADYATDVGTGLPMGLRLGIEKFRLGHGRKYTG